MDYDIFREELALKYPSYGYALWDPSPQGRYSAVQVGDVGFIHQGYFHRLFNILLPQDHPSHRDGAPPHHEPLEVNINMPTYRGTLPPNNLRSNGVSDTSDVDRRLTSEQSSFPSVGFSNYDPNSPDPAATRHSFSCSNKRGALLSLPLPAQREETAVRKTFEKFMVEHIDEWFAFAQGLGLGIDREWDLILVTGRHLARSWANVVFLERDQKVSFGFRVSRGSDVEWEFTPEGAGGAALNLGPIGQDLPEDQCIFVKGIHGMTFLQRLPRWLLRRASPPQMQGEFEPDPDIELRSVPEDIHYQDPLHTLLEYISTQAPDCDMALVHDDDLECIASASIESLRPDSLMNYLQKSAPEIRQVKFGLTLGSPTSHSNKLPSKHKAMPRISKVAMLASDVAYDVESIISQNERNTIDERVMLSPRSHQNLPPNAGASTTTGPQDTLEELLPFVEEKRQRSINPHLSDGVIAPHVPHVLQRRARKGGIGVQSYNIATERNYTVELNNFLQGHPTGDLTPFLHYALTRYGPDNSAVHVARAIFRGNSYGEGRGTRVGVAKREAAMRALEYFLANGVPNDT